MQSPQPAFLSNNYSPQKGPNFGSESNQQNPLSPTKEPFQNHGDEGHHLLPTSSA